MKSPMIRLLTPLFLTPLYLSAVLLTGCSTIHYDNVYMEKNGTPVATTLSAEQKKSISDLTLTLKNLGPNTSAQEATAIAYDSVIYSMILANQYGLTSPPLYHNYLVNTKKRPRGLCYHWQRDLRTQLKKRHLKTFDLKEGVANEAKYWTEHNALIVTAKGQPFANGVILDGWRNSGKLLWMKVQKDKKYHWKERVWKQKQFTQSKIPKAS